MGDIHKVAEPDHIIKDVVGKFPTKTHNTDPDPIAEESVLFIKGL
ncbi:hypothetical protein [Paenibacillus xylanexedens]